jgi:hypothetical protein
MSSPQSPALEVVAILRTAEAKVEDPADEEHGVLVSLLEGLDVEDRPLLLPFCSRLCPLLTLLP